MRDHSVKRMDNLLEDFKTFKNPHNAVYGTPEFYQDFLWHWMTRVRLLSRFGDGILSQGDFKPDEWRGLVEAAAYFEDLGHYIKLKSKDTTIYFTHKPLFWQKRKK